MEWDQLKFRRMFPNLYRELEGNPIPTVLNHLEICSSNKEALEIIDYFERIGEIDSKYAGYLRENLSEISLVGSRKRGDYEREGL